MSRLSLARLTLVHRGDPTTTKSRFTYRVTIDGATASLFVRVIGQTIAGGLPTAMRALARLAEPVPPATLRPKS